MKCKVSPYPRSVDTYIEKKKCPGNWVGVNERTVAGLQLAGR